MTFDDYQACLNALFAADRQLNLVQARFAASDAAGATLDAFQLLRLAMVQCFERLEQQYGLNIAKLLYAATYDYRQP